MGCGRVLGKQSGPLVVADLKEDETQVCVCVCVWGGGLGPESARLCSCPSWHGYLGFSPVVPGYCRHLGRQMVGYRVWEGNRPANQPSWRSRLASVVFLFSEFQQPTNPVNHRIL